MPIHNWWFISECVFKAYEPWIRESKSAEDSTLNISITWSDAFLLRVRALCVYKPMNIVPGTCTKNQTMVQASKQPRSYESFFLHPNILNTLYQKIWQFQQDSHFATTKITVYTRVQRTRDRPTGRRWICTCARISPTPHKPMQTAVL